jgi:ABC-type transport system involved in cytochrome c biogenesis permease subunit
VLDSSIFWLRAATCFYAVGLFSSLLALVRRRNVPYAVAQGAFRIGVVLHSVAIVDLGRAIGRLPVENVFQALSLCALLIAILFLIVEWRYQYASSAFVAHFPLVFLMTLVAAMERRVVVLTDVRVRETWLAVHIVLVLAGYAALLLTAVASILYLIQERRLKTKRAGSLLERLPPLAVLDNLISRSLGVAFVLITLGVIVVMTWAFVYSGTSWIGDPRITVSLITWALLLGATYLRATVGWRGRKAAVMALVILGCSVFTWAAHAGLRPGLAP